MKREEPVDETIELRRRITELEKAEVEYRLLEEKLVLAKGEWERTFDTVPDLIAIIDNQYRMVRVNKALADKLGASPKDVVGQPCYEAFCGSQEPPLECPHRKTLVDGKETTAEIAMKRLGGDYLITVSPFRDGAGKLTGSVYVARDITDRKKAEAELRESRERYQTLFEESPTSLWVEDFSEVKRCLDEKRAMGIGDFRTFFDNHPEAVGHCLALSRVVDVNRATLELFEAGSKEELTGNLGKTFVEEAYNHFRENLIGLVEGKTFSEIETVAQTLTGKKIHIALRWSVASGHEETFSRVLVSMKDITERKLAENERETSRRFLHSVMDGVEDLIIVFGRDFSVKLMNRAAREFAGGDHSLSTPLFCYQVFFQGNESCSRIEEVCPLEEVIEAKKPVTVTHACVRQDGSEVIFEIQASPITDERGEVVQIIQVCRDVTQKLMMEETRRKIEEQLTQEQKEQSITTLAGGIAHDFNNILMGVLGNAELLQMRLAPYEKEQTLIQNIIRSGERMADLTKQLLTYAKSTLSQPEVVFLHDIVGEALALTHKGASLDMEVIVDMPEDLWPVFVDPGQMSQVFVNLFTNAFEAMGLSRGLLTVRAENTPNKESWECPIHKRRHPEGDYVYVRVSDTGPGIPKDILRQIFDPFVTTKFLGRGLGLAAAFGIIRSHNGCISVESDQGQGATFHIYLPRAKTGGAVRRTEVKKTVSGQILVVDDEPQVLSLLETVLTHAGYKVLVASNGEEALRLFGHWKDDIEMAILDIQMPGMGGKRLFVELKALKPSLKVLISSGYDERTALEGIQNYVPEGFIQKPYLSGVLEGKVREILRGQTASRG